MYSIDLGTPLLAFRTLLVTHHHLWFRDEHNHTEIKFSMSYMIQVLVAALYHALKLLTWSSNFPCLLQKVVYVQQISPPQHIITSEKLPQSTSGILSNIIEGPPHRAVSFHERATSKDVIDELNRMIKSGDENVSSQEQSNENGGNARLDQACRPTGWIHVEKDIDLNDPKVDTFVMISWGVLVHSAFL